MQYELHILKHHIRECDPDNFRASVFVCALHDVLDPTYYCQQHGTEAVIYNRHNDHEAGTIRLPQEAIEYAQQLKVQGWKRTAPQMFRIDIEESLLL